jgi:hypothetical protein
MALHQIKRTVNNNSTDAPKALFRTGCVFLFKFAVIRGAKSVFLPFVPSFQISVRADE